MGKHSRSRAVNPIHVDKTHHSVSAAFLARWRSPSESSACPALPAGMAWQEQAVRLPAFGVWLESHKQEETQDSHRWQALESGHLRQTDLLDLPVHLLSLPLEILYALDKFVIVIVKISIRNRHY